MRQKIYRIKNTFKALYVFLAVIIALQLMLTACDHEQNSIADVYTYTTDGGYIAESGNYLYYYQFSHASVDLYRCDLSNGTSEFIDNIHNANTMQYGASRMFSFHGKIYYAKINPDDQSKTMIYSINDENITPVFEGEINDRLYSEIPEFSEDDYRMFYADKTYVLMRNTLYRLNDGTVETVTDNINSIYYDGDEIYYSLITGGDGYSTETSGVFCYDIQSGESNEIISADTIREYNADTVIGPQVFVRNIIKYNDRLYFIGAHHMSPVLMYDMQTNSLNAVNSISEGAASAFRLHDNKIFFTDINLSLCFTDTVTTDTAKIADGILSYTVSRANVYYYTMTDLLPSQLRVYNTEDLSDAVLLDFS